MNQGTQCDSYSFDRHEKENIDHAIIGRMTPVHQFARIGKYAVVGGFSRITHDVPPYTIGAGTPYKLSGLNLVGLRRHGFRTLMKDLFKLERLSAVILTVII